MRSDNLFRLLQRLDYMIRQTRDQRALLLLGSSSSNGIPTNLSPLQHTQLESHPLSTDPLLRTLYLGMIARRKKHYKRTIAKKSVNLLASTCINNPYKLDICKAAMWTYDHWTLLKHESIYNYWPKSELEQISVVNELRYPTESVHFVLSYYSVVAIIKCSAQVYSWNLSVTKWKKVD